VVCASFKIYFNKLIQTARYTLRLRHWYVLFFSFSKYVCETQKKAKEKKVKLRLVILFLQISDKKRINKAHETTKSGRESSKP